MCALDFPILPQLPDDDPLESIKILHRYLRSLGDYCLSRWATAAITAIVAVPTVLFGVAWSLIGLDTSLSWASDFVPLAFAFAGIAFSIRKLRHEYQSLVIAMIAIVGVMGTIVLHVERTRAASRLFAAASLNTDILNKLSNPQKALTAQEAAVQRLQNIRDALRAEYILSHTNISSQLLAGMEDPPVAWMNERLQQMGETLRFAEPTAKPSQRTTVQSAVPNAPLPEVALKFENAPAPLLVVQNISSAVATNGGWVLGIWNMDSPNDLNPLQIPSTPFNFIKPHSELGPQNIFNNFPIKKGDRLFGSAFVDCAECAKGKTYIVYIVWGMGGWFSEIKSSNSNGILVPIKLDADHMPGFFASLDGLAPLDARVPIKEEQLQEVH